MKNMILFYPLTLLTLNFICCDQKQNHSEGNELSFEGTWELIQYKPDESQARWLTYGDSIIYQKHLSADHFTWFQFDSKNNQLLGMGGGSYSIQDNTYVEKIEFFYPPGSSELGQSIPFQYEVNNNKWYHLGYSKLMAVNMESGKLEVIDSAKIEELWVKTKLSPNDHKDLIGTWDLIAYRDSVNAEYTEYPDFVGYLKLLTPTHFTWIYFDKDGDEVYAAGSGRYRFDGKHYTETIDMIYPDNFGQLGSTVEFKAKVTSNKWEHKGYVPSVRIDNSNGKLVYDSSFVDETWKLHTTSITDGITF